MLSAGALVASLSKAGGAELIFAMALQEPAITGLQSNKTEVHRSEDKKSG
jgi:hypothetical protein